MTPHGKYITVFINKGAGQGADRAEHVREAFAQAREHARIHGSQCEHLDDVRIEIVEGKTTIEAVKKNVAAGATIVVAAGGDGTIGAIASVIVGTEVQLGILPMGTLNHFAKDAGIPLDLTEAARVIATGYVKAVDVGEVNGRVFINNSSIGLYPIMVRDRESQRKHHKRSKWWAMLLASLATFRKFPTFTVDVVIDGSRVRYNTPSIFVGNNVYQVDGIDLGRRVALDEGKICLFAVKTLSKWRALGLVVRGLVLRNLDSAIMEIACAEKLRLEMSLATIDVSLDGEVVKLEPPLNYGVLRHYLHVILPASE